MSKICPNCGNENASNYIYCRHCGSQLPATTPPPQQAVPKPNVIYCPSCSRQNPVDATICANCGYQIKPGEPMRKFRWYYCFTFPLFIIFEILSFCFGSCCCCCSYDSSGRRRRSYSTCDTSGCDLTGCGSNGCDCGDCDCGDCDCGDCDLGGCDCDCG
ncbi:MAG: zinc ribbon domain-containing protein [Candidatus Heimdallarchaeota archaeon]